MLQEILRDHGAEILARAAVSAGSSVGGAASHDELLRSGGRFLQQLGERSGTPPPAIDGLAAGAAERGAALQREGIPLAALVQAYGHLCQAIRDTRAVSGEALDAAQLGLLDRCHDEAIAEAVKAYLGARDRAAATAEAARLNRLIHDLRNQLNNAKMAFEILQTEKEGVRGNVAMMLGRALTGLMGLIDPQRTVLLRGEVV